MGDEAVVDEIELHATLDGDNAPLGVDEPDVGVRGKDFGEGGVHAVADGGAEFFDGGEAAVGWGAGVAEVCWLLWGRFGG